MIKKISRFLSKINKKEEPKVEPLINDLESPAGECGPGHFTQGYGWLGNAENYVGVPAPKVLEDDPWFGPAPKSDKQKEYQEATKRLHEDMRKEKESETVESDNIHNEMYRMATKNWNTVDETKQSMGGSENIWNSGTGMGQYR